jgi:hypothetical protein
MPGTTPIVREGCSRPAVFGTVLAVDGQGARFQDWPPSRGGLGFDESEMSRSNAIYFTVDGKALRQ